MFDASGSPGTQNAVRILRILERIIREMSDQNALYARLSLLQSFPRLLRNESVASAAKDPMGAAVPDFLSQFCEALCPNWYESVFSLLNEDELEVFLKSYIHAHETWGRPEGIGALVRTMLEGCVHAPVSVCVQDLKSEERQIPMELLSRLGDTRAFSRLGNDFLLGSRFQCRPVHYEIHVGPVRPAVLDMFQRAGWADGTRPSEKLRRLAEIAEPFYLYAKIRFLFETTGFVLGKATAGKSCLGIVGGVMGESTMLLEDSRITAQPYLVGLAVDS
jgi:hypothetical protein